MQGARATRVLEFGRCGIGFGKIRFIPLGESHIQWLFLKLFEALQVQGVRAQPGDLLLIFATRHKLSHFLEKAFDHDVMAIKAIPIRILQIKTGVS